MYAVKGICILDNDGNRILSKYYDETLFETTKEQRAFEKKLFGKTHRANTEIIMFDGITCLYKSNIDLFFYVFGSADENELVLASVLTAYYDAISIVLRDAVEKVNLFENMDAVMLITDEIVDGGIILESDPGALAQFVVKAGKDTDLPLGDQTLSQALNVAGGLLRKHLLN